MFKGRYSRTDAKLFDQVDIAKYASLKIDDVLLFTYLGASQFNVMMFDKLRVEEMIEDDTNNVVKPFLKKI